jgi:hypothetical protein
MLSSLWSLFFGLENVCFPVMPAQAGIQSSKSCLDSRLSTLRSRATEQDGRSNDGVPASEVLFKY